MNTFSFSTVRIVLKNLGFDVIGKDPDFKLMIFRHPLEKTEVIIGMDNQLDESYVKARMKQIRLPFGYFVSMTITLRNLKKK